MEVYAVVGWEITFEELYRKWDCQNIDDFYNKLDDLHYHVQNWEFSGVDTNYYFGVDMYITGSADSPAIMDEVAFCQWVKDTKHRMLQEGSTKFTGGIYMPLRPRLFIVAEQCNKNFSIQEKIYMI